MTNIINFYKKEKVKIITNCSFCNNPLVKGKYVQSEETEPAICFSCIARCKELLSDGDKNDEND